MSNKRQRTEGDLASTARAAGVKYVLFSFTDLFGTQRSKLVPISAVASMQGDGAGFAGFAAWFDLVPKDADVLCVPDASSFVVLPWQPEVGWVACDAHISGKPLMQAPRQALKKAMGMLREKHGLEMKVGVELEFFLIDPAAQGPQDARDTQAKPCYDQSALMRRYALIDELVQHMETLGWGPYQCDHEDANGQFEMNFTFANALVTADRTCLFKYMVKSLAEKHGTRATFMPKPFAHLTGNGAHVHVTLHRIESPPGVTDNTFAKVPAPEGASGVEFLSDQARHFVAGVLENGPGLAAFTNPTVNSYKRIHCPSPDSGATWAPPRFTWGGNDRTVLIRTPDAPRIELRLPDGAANPYVSAAAVLAAGMQGVEAGAAPPAPGDNLRAAAVPRNLLDALRAAREPRLYAQLCAWMGGDCVDAYLKLKERDEWTRHQMAISQWELDNTLDC